MKNNRLTTKVIEEEDEKESYSAPRISEEDSSISAPLLNQSSAFDSFQA